MAKNKRIDVEKRRDHPFEILKLDGFDCEIDKDMVPVIKWFYSKGAKTHFCCQGDDGTSYNSRPYVIWCCEDRFDLISIMDVLTNRKYHREEKISNRKTETVYIKTEVEFFEDFYGYDGEVSPYVRYITRWPCNSILRDFTKCLL